MKKLCLSVIFLWIAMVINALPCYSSEEDGKEIERCLQFITGSDYETNCLTTINTGEEEEIEKLIAAADEYLQQYQYCRVIPYLECDKEKQVRRYDWIHEAHEETITVLVMQDQTECQFLLIKGKSGGPGIPVNIHEMLSPEFTGFGNGRAETLSRYDQELMTVYRGNEGRKDSYITCSFLIHDEGIEYLQLCFDNMEFVYRLAGQAGIEPETPLSECLTEIKVVFDADFSDRDSKEQIIGIIEDLWGTLRVSEYNGSPEYAKTAAYTEDTAVLGQTFGDEIWFKDAVAESKRISAAQGEQGRVTVVFNGRKEAILKKLILMND